MFPCSPCCSFWSRHRQAVGSSASICLNVSRGPPLRRVGSGFCCSSSLARASALALSAIRTAYCPSCRRPLRSRLLASSMGSSACLDLGGVARYHAHDAPAERALDQRRVHLVRQIALRELGKSAKKTWIWRTCRIRPPGCAEDLSMARRSIRAVVVGIPRIALATNALARAWWFGGLRGPGAVRERRLRGQSRRES